MSILPDYLRTEVLTFDLHHRWFLILFRHLEDNVKAERWGFADWACEKVGRYLLVHNGCEEHSMQRFQYDHIAEHKKAHTFFVRRWDQISEATTQRRLDLSDVADFRQALIDHIASDDQRYSDYFERTGRLLQANNVLWRDGLALMP